MLLVKSKTLIGASLVAQWYRIYFLWKRLPAVQAGQIPGPGRFPGEGNDNPLQYSCLGNPMDRGAWQARVHGVTRVEHNLATKPPSPPKHLQ